MFNLNRGEPKGRSVGTDRQWLRSIFGQDRHYIEAESKKRASPYNGVPRCQFRQPVVRRDPVSIFLRRGAIMN